MSRLLKPAHVRLLRLASTARWLWTHLAPPEDESANGPAETLAGSFFLPDRIG
jgi:hypothetical protein